MFGIDDAIAAGSKLVDDVVTRVWPNATEIEKAKLAQVAAEAQNQFNLILGQLEINKTEAASPSLFVSGWRPAVGWCGALGYGYEFLWRPLANGLAIAIGLPPPFPSIEVEALSSLLFGLLGIGALRTVEKVKGVARHQ